jgi:hypothetical protein
MAASTAYHTTVSANLRNDKLFPSFDNCPDENDIDLDYYNQGNDGVFYPSRHWCLVGEITEVSFFIRPRLILKDKAGAEIILSFYLDNEEAMTLDHDRLKQGHTVAVMYPQRHCFLDMSVGLRIEVANTVEVSIIGHRNDLSY